MVHTADGVGIPGVGVSVAGSGQTATTDSNGAASVTAPGSTFTVSLTATNYVPQSVTVVTSSNGVVTWDDPATVVTGSGSQMTLSVPMGRMASAPTVAVTITELDGKILPLPAAAAAQLTKSKQRAETYVVPLQHTFTVEDGEYAFLFAGQRNFSAVTGLRMLGDPDQPGWPALNDVSPRPTTPNLGGSFTWVEWGPSSSAPPDLNRYLVGLWRPRTSYLSGSRPQDAIVFYTPTTTPPDFPRDSKPFRRNYPYALNGVTKGDGTFELLMAERYVALGFRYLFNELWLAYQQLAAARDALLILPIQPSAQWADNADIAGVQRLLLEAILFEHRERAGVLDPKPDSNDLDIAPLGDFKRQRFQQQLPPPRLGTVCLAGFSAGVGAVKTVMQAELSFRPSAKARSWNDELANPYRAAPTTLIASWRETWDIDAPSSIYGSAGSWAKFLRTWETNGKRTDRIARCYHSEHTGWGPTDPDAMQPATGHPTLSKDATAASASRHGARGVERHGPSGSAVWFSNNYLAGNGPPSGWNKDADAPAYWSYKPHSVMPVVCFAHAAANSRLQSL